MKNQRSTLLLGKTHRFSWVCSANLYEGLTYTIVNVVSVALFSDMGMDNTSITFYTSLLALPWSFKALWSPIIENRLTKHRWMSYSILLQCLLYIGIGISLSLVPQAYFIPLLLFAVAAFMGATYDISCDGYYMDALSNASQSYFVGIRTMAYRLGMILGNGGILFLAGYCSTHFPQMMQSSSPKASGWSLAFIITGLVYWIHRLIHGRLLPQIEKPHAQIQSVSQIQSYKEAFQTFILKKGLWFTFVFLLFYRLGEALLSKITILFLKDEVANGGLGLSNEQYGLIYGTFGVIALIAGGIIGGIVISRYDIKRSIVPMALWLNVPDLLYVWMSHSLPTNLRLITMAVTCEQFGYGFGLSAYTVYLLRAAKGSHMTSHYAFLTCIMALGLTIPSLISGWLQQNLGYFDFFVATCLFTIPGLILSIIIWRKKGPLFE